MRNEMLGQHFFRRRSARVWKGSGGFYFGESIHVFKKFGLQRRHLEGLTNPEFSRAAISWNQDAILIQ